MVEWGAASPSPLCSLGRRWPCPAFGASFNAGSANNQATATYTVVAPSGKTVKDLHFEPGSPKSQNLKAPLSDPAPAMPTGWTAGSGTSDHQFVTTQGSGISGGSPGTFTFTFHTGGNYAKSTKTLKQVKVTLTDDGTEEIKPGVNVVEEGGRPDPERDRDPDRVVVDVATTRSADPRERGPARR